MAPIPGRLDVEHLAKLQQLGAYMRRKNMAEVERETQVVEKVKLPTTTVVEGEATEPNEVEPQDHDSEDDES